MSLIDAKNEYSNDQAVTVSAASTNVIDHGAAGDAHEELYVEILVTETFAGGTNLTPKLETDDAATFASATVLWTGATSLTAALVAGTRLALFRLPKGMEQFSRLYYTVTGTHTAGKIQAHLVKTPANN